MWLPNYARGTVTWATTWVAPTQSEFQFYLMPPTQPPTRGESFEKAAFGFCKIALFCLLTGRFALPLAATGAALFFGLAVWNGKRDTRCWAKHPLGIAAFWLGVTCVWLWKNWHP